MPRTLGLPVNAIDLQNEALTLVFELESGANGLSRVYTHSSIVKVCVKRADG